MSFLKIGDRAAGAIKSGGTTRRAAKMVVVDIDHPDIESYINWKVTEEQKVAALVTGSKVLSERLNAILRSCVNCEGELLRTRPHAKREPHHPQRDLPELRPLPDGSVSVEREAINAIYKDAGGRRGPGACSSTRTSRTSPWTCSARTRPWSSRAPRRTCAPGFMNLKVPGGPDDIAGAPDVVRVPFTHVKVFGWYDNEMGSDTYRLGELTIRAARSM